MSLTKTAAEQLLKIAEEIEKEAMQATNFVCNKCKTATTLDQINGAIREYVKRQASSDLDSLLVDVNDKVKCSSCEEGVMSYAATEESEKFYEEVEEDDGDVKEAASVDITKIKEFFSKLPSDVKEKVMGSLHSVKDFFVETDPYAWERSDVKFKNPQNTSRESRPDNVKMDLFVSNMEKARQMAERKGIPVEKVVHSIDTLKENTFPVQASGGKEAATKDTEALAFIILSEVMKESPGISAEEAMTKAKTMFKTAQEEVAEDDTFINKEALGRYLI